MRALVWFLVRAAAAWRITELVVEDEVSRETREWVDRHAPDKVKYLVSCKRCVSVWAGFAVLYLLPRRWVYALAASAVTMLVEEQVQMQQQRAFRARVEAMRSGTAQPGQ